MGVTAPVVDGKLVDTSYDSESTAKKTGGNSSLDKDAFLQLLVAQMKYQDPLEPTSNTEFISQFATFSELEEMQNMRLGMDVQRAQGLVGENVIVENEEGEFIQGDVDYVTLENGKIFLNIGDNRYSLDNLSMVVDKDFQTAFDKVNDFVNRLNKLPSKNLLTTTNMKELFELQEIYEEMSNYEKSFIGKDVVTLLEEKVKKMEELMKLEGITYEKPEKVTTEGLLQDLLDKMDQILKDVGNISGNVSGKDDEGGTEEEGGSGNTEGNGSEGGKVDGSGGSTEGGEVDTSGSANGGEVDGSGSADNGEADGSGSSEGGSSPDGGSEGGE